MNRLHFLVFLFFSISTGVIAQTKREIDALNQRIWKLCFEEPDSAKQLAENTIHAAQKIHYQKGLGEAKAKLGVIYDLEGKPEKALKLLLEAIHLQEKSGDSSGLSFSYNNLGLLHYGQYNYPKALIYLQKSLEIDKRRGDQKSAVGSMINIGIIYTYLKRVNKAQVTYMEALEMSLALKDSSNIGACYANLGTIYFNRGDYQNAIDCYQKNEAYLQGNNHSERLSANSNELANCFLKLHDYATALRYAEKDLEVCKRYHLLNRKQFAYEVLHDIYAAQNDYRKAYYYLQLYTRLRDQLLNEDRNSAIAEMETRYETAKKEKKLVQANLAREKVESRNRTQRILLTVISVVSLLIIGFVVWAYFSKRRINKLLSEKNTLDEAIIAQKELLMAEVHHRVKNNLQLISSIIELQLRTIADETAVDHVKDIQKRVESIAVLHQFLYQSDDVEAVEMDTYIKELAGGLKQSFGTEAKKISLTFEVVPMKLAVATAVPLGLIINELLTNSLKHAFLNVAEGNIGIGLERVAENLILTVQDNGSGAVSASKDESFGWRMIRSLCRQLNATWEQENEHGLRNKLIIKRFKVYE